MDEAVAQRLLAEHNIWLATVRPPGADRPARPHLVPVWFVWLPRENRLYFSTDTNTVKVRNLAQNPEVALALESGGDPVILEGVALRLDAVPEGVARAFLQKYDWDLPPPDERNALFAVTPRKMLRWG